ncbi:MAG: type II toxin-antitoxin system RelB/DinJ family antitoxin [Coriobacteriales bacterium]|nr:type II toxin-antitoxin system RelB/DinJ family antitoxin [Coriobacteriales bacterium]
MGVVQISARIDAQDKREGDATLARLGVSATDAIRALWSYLAQTQMLPSFMRGLEHEGHVPSAEGQKTSSTVHSDSSRGAGLALTLARQEGLVVPSDDVSYGELRDLAFEELMAEGVYRV